jgi:peptidoglycan/xylan/chitin deacetylase (PgdA/CDA1 family)
VPRVLDLLQRYDLPATFFIPGHTVDSLPEPVEAILKGGYEIGHHSNAHVDPSDQTAEEERDDMERARSEPWSESE